MNKNFLKITTIMLAAILLISGEIVLGLYLPQWLGGQNVSVHYNLDENALDWQEPQEGQIVNQYIDIPGYPYLYFKANDQSAEVNFLNPASNPCFFVFALVLDKTGQVIYQSQMVAPGKFLPRIQLQHGLAQGEYPATIQITTFSLDNLQNMNGSNQKTLINVQ
ncbi:MAG: hypothetical protein RR396_01590 [Clostridiales bacterium]